MEGIHIHPILLQYGKKQKGSHCLFEEIDESYSDADIVIAIAELPEFADPECFLQSDFQNHFECALTRNMVPLVIMPPSVANYVYVRKIMANYYF